MRLNREDSFGLKILRKKNGQSITNSPANSCMHLPKVLGVHARVVHFDECLS